MIRHLTAADFHPMPWANGKGVTIELARAEGPTGLLWRLSRASVIEIGPFSIFPGIERNLTILTGPGFDLMGEGIALNARPFAPVAFPGDVPVTATGVTTPSDDFNVMTARHLPRPQVQVVSTAQTLMPPANSLLAVYAALANTLTLTDEPLAITPQEPLLVVLLHLPNG